MERDILIRILMLVIPSAVVFVAGAGSALMRRSQIADQAVAGRSSYIQKTNTLLAIIMTNVWYAIVMAFLAGSTLDQERVAAVSVTFFVIVSLMLLVSVAGKSVIVHLYLTRIAAAERELSKCMLFLAIAEIPGLAALGLFMSKFMVEG